jgi:hypothetical protein
MRLHWRNTSVIRVWSTRYLCLPLLELSRNGMTRDVFLLTSFYSWIIWFHFVHTWRHLDSSVARKAGERMKVLSRSEAMMSYSFVVVIHPLTSCARRRNIL